MSTEEKKKDFGLILSAFAKKRAAELANFFRSTWVFLSFFFCVTAILFLISSARWDFWAEQTFNANGVVTEVKIDRLKILQQVGLFFVAVIGLTLAIWRSLTSHRQAIASLEQSKTAIRQAETANRQAEIAENNQRFDRYARAAQMLDNEKSAVRQAGVYLLRELAIGDEKYRDLCSELLASFIRSRFADSSEEVHGTDKDAKKKLDRTPSAIDIVDAFRSLYRAGGSKDPINLSDIVLSKFSLSEPASLANVDFSHSQLYLINLHRMLIKDCDFSRASFCWNTVHQTKLSENAFFDTTFDNVDFEDVDFEGTQFWYCKFDKCTFKNCNLSGVQFLDDDGLKKLPFEASLFEDCWAWKGSLPELGAKFSGTVYDPGPQNRERISFAKRWEARRLGGLNYSDTRPSKKT